MANYKNKPSIKDTLNTRLSTYRIHIVQKYPYITIMKVYAEFIKENGKQFRTRTILQFGDSWDLIGSIVMKNPGSSCPINPVNKDILDAITARYPLASNNNWYEFKSDPTMTQVGSLFNGSYLGNSKPLNGIILIFNLFNIIEKNITKAKKLASASTSIHLYPNEDETIKSFENKPVYLAWRWEYLKINRSFAENIFEHVKQSPFMYLKNDMIDNHFYHPGYINTSYARTQVQETLKSFLSLY